MYRDRLDRVREAMADQGVDVAAGVGRATTCRTSPGYEAMPLERLTMLVVPRDGDATLVVPELEAPRVVEQPGVFTVRPWDETDDPIGIVAKLAAGAATAAVGDQMWARFLVELLPHLPGTEFRRAVDVDRPAAHASRTPPRSTPCAPPGPPPTGSPRSCTPARSRWSGAPRPPCRPTSPPA